MDTCHVWDAGYDIANHLDDVLAEFDHIFCFNRLKAIHLYDSMNPVGSHNDRHARLGEDIIIHPALRHLPFYLETPNDLDGYAREIAMMREAWS